MHLAKKVGLWVLAAVVSIIAIGVGGFAYLYATTPLSTAPPLIQTSYLFDRRGDQIGSVHAEIDRTVVPLADIAEPLQQAVVATEDQSYYDHAGISLGSMARAAWVNLGKGQVVEGGSTITQQYVKNVYTGDDATYARKMREAILALKLDRQLTKDQVLERYLNTIYFGHGAYGVEAAARTYWNKSASQLGLLQSATLAGLIAAPSDADPLTHPKEARRRRDTTLAAMSEQGIIPPSELPRLLSTPLRLSPGGARLDSRAPFFTDFVRTTAEDTYGASSVAGGGLRIDTSLDLNMQQEAEDAVAEHLPGRDDPEAALVAIDPATGEILAMVGGRSYRDSQVNLATGDCEGCNGRSAGSAFKVFTIAAALEHGIEPSSDWRGPPEIRIHDPACGPWHVANYADEGAGTMDLYDATAESVNTIFAQIVAKVGPPAVVEVAHRMGIVSPLEPVCSITLGTQGVNPLEMTSAFATIANDGIAMTPTPITRVSDAQGTVLFQATASPRAAISSDHARTITKALEGVVDHGTGTAAALEDRPVAGKTGTAQDYTDAWFCGYAPQLATCVWVGYPEGQVPMENVQGVPQVYGGSIPAEIWHDFMEKATHGMPVKAFLAPSRGHDPSPSEPSVNTPDQPDPEPIEGVAPIATTSPTSPAPSPSPLPTTAPPMPAPSIRPSPSPRPSPTPSPSPSP